MRLKEFAPAGGGGSGNYFKELASAWYNGTFDTGSLQKGIKSQQDVERLLNRGIVCPDGKTRKLHIDYNSDFDGVEIYSDDYYEYGDHDDTIDSRTGQKWGPYDFMAFSDEDLSEDLNEFAADDGNDGGEDDALRNYAKMWWAGDEATQMQIERVLARMGWEIGEDEGSYDNGGVFVIRAGDINGDSYQSWAAEDLTEGLTEIDRRGFLKGMGAAAVAGTAGYMGGVRRVQNTTLARVLGKLNGFLKPLKASRVKDKWSYELITRTQDLIQRYKIDPDIYNDSLYSFGENQGERAYSMAFRNGIQTSQDREKYEAMLFELSADLMNATSFHPKYSGTNIFADSVQQGVAEGAPISGDGGAVDNFKQQMANNTELAYQKGMAEAKKKKKKKSSRSLGRYFFPGYGYYGTGDSGEGGGDGGGESKNRGMTEGSEDPFGPQGRFVGDTGPAQISTTVPRVQLRIGDRVLYKPTEQRATIEALSKDGTKARIHISSPMGGKIFNCKTADLKALGALKEKSTSQAQFRTMAAAAHDPEFARKVGIKQSVAREFNQADKGQSYKSLPKKS